MIDRPILDFGDGFTLWRVPISVPCQVPVVPGTPDSGAPIEQRTERCAIDAYWMLGRAFVCDHHLQACVEDDVMAEVLTAYPWVEWERRPWDEMHRYPQEQARPGWAAECEEFGCHDATP